MTRHGDYLTTFESVSILLPTLNETFSFIQTVDIILEECDHRDIKEFIAIVCDRTSQESLDSIKYAKETSEKNGVPLKILWQDLPFAGGAVRDGMDSAEGSHTIMMAPDLETDPRLVKRFIEMAKINPDDMITASRWIDGGSFEGYSRTKNIMNLIFQRVFAIFYGVELTDISFGYRIAPTALFQSISWEETGHPFFLETALKPIRLGIKIHEIPSRWKSREEGSSQNDLVRTFKYLRIAFKVRFQKKDRILKEDVSAYRVEKDCR